jgi:cytochrome c oxidase subunit 1
MPRRIPDYPLHVQRSLNMLPPRIGAFILGASHLVFLYNVVVKCVRGGQEGRGAQSWDGAHGLEWTVPSPAPYHTFETQPVVK